MNPDRSALKSAATDSENPWIGLWSYPESLAGQFHGRDQETAKLIELVQRELVVVLFGASGLGKTSLLHAGLAPELRRRHGLPVLCRLDFSDATPLPQQLLLQLREAAAEIGAHAPQPANDDSLWAYFHRCESEVWSADNRRLLPVIILDQFEEVFTLGNRDETARRRVRDLLDELSCLVENRPPESFRAAVKANPPLVAGFDFAPAQARLVFCLREDFVPELEALRPRMRALATSRLRLLPMTGLQALEVIEKNGQRLVEDGVAHAIVQFVAAAPQREELAALTASDEDANLAGLAVDPALLSVTLYELCRHRHQTSSGRITKTLLQGSKGAILEGFYQRSLEGLPPHAARFVEERLLTPTGWRDSRALDEALACTGVDLALLDRLVERRLLRYEDRHGQRRIELAHDVLAEVVRHARDNRRKAESLRAAVNEAERKAAERVKLEFDSNLSRTQRMESLGVLAGGVAHDFNNVLTAILGNTELARMDLPEAHPVLESLEQIQRAATRASEIVRQLLSFSRKQHFQLVHLHLRTVVQEIQKLLRATIPARIELDVSVPELLPQVHGDASQIHQVLMNLCINSVQAMPAGKGRISISLASLVADDVFASAHSPLKPGRVVCLSVEDDGCGMSQEVQQRIFEPFFTTKAPGQGTGLGLSVVHGIVRAHEGAIRVKSSPGAGTRFDIYLPAIEETEPAATHSPAANTPPVTGRILVVDDEPEIAAITQRTLSRMGYTAEAFTAPEAALKAFSNNPDGYDLVLADWNMPGMTGVELSLEIRKLRPNIVLLVMSGYLADTSNEEIRGAVAEFVPKPFSVEDLKTAIGRHLPRRRPPAPSPPGASFTR